MKIKSTAIFYVLSFSLLIATSSCDNADNGSGEETTTTEEADQNAANKENEGRIESLLENLSKTNPGSEKKSINNEQVQKILNRYLELKDAMVESDGVKASEAASSLVEATGDVENSLAQKIQEDAKAIADSKDLEAQRLKFKKLSISVYSLAQQQKASEGTLYLQFCPMAFDNEGAYWVSTEKEIRNPYFGDKMLKCGEIRDEF